MDWYYAAGGESKGPIGAEEFERLVQQGTINNQTQVWREGMATWQPYSGSTPPAPAATGAPPIGNVTCGGCGRSFPAGEVIALGEQRYCASCKPLAVQRLKEGVVTSGAADETRKQFLKHEASVKSIGFLYYIGGTALVLAAIMAVVISASTALAYGVGRGTIFLGLGIAQFWVGSGLRRLKSWARIPSGILSGLGLLAVPIGTLINAYILYLIFSKKGKMVFSDEYQEVIRQTPHIKYRTSIVIWILLGLLVALIGFAGLAIFLAPHKR